MPRLPVTTPRSFRGPIVTSASKRAALSSSTQVLPLVRMTSTSQPRARPVTTLIMAQMRSMPGKLGTQSPRRRPRPAAASRALDRAKLSSASYSTSTRWARAPKARPSGVGVTPELARLKSGAPVSPSSSDMALETAWTETPSRAAAAEKLPVARIATTYLSCFMFTNGPPCETRCRERICVMRCA